MKRGFWIGKWIIDLGALPLSAGFGAVREGRFDLALRAQGSVWSVCGAWWGLMAVLWAGAEECGGYGEGAGIIQGISADPLL